LLELKEATATGGVPQAAVRRAASSPLGRQCRSPGVSVRRASSGVQRCCGGATVLAKGLLCEGVTPSVSRTCSSPLPRRAGSPLPVGAATSSSASARGVSSPWTPIAIAPVGAASSLAPAPPSPTPQSPEPLLQVARPPPTRSWSPLPHFPRPAPSVQRGVSGASPGVGLIGALTPAPPVPPRQPPLTPRPSEAEFFWGGMPRPPRPPPFPAAAGVTRSPRQPPQQLVMGQWTPCGTPSLPPHFGAPPRSTLPGSIGASLALGAPVPVSTPATDPDFLRRSLGPPLLAPASAPGIGWGVGGPAVIADDCLQCGMGNPWEPCRFGAEVPPSQLRGTGVSYSPRQEDLGPYPALGAPLAPSLGTPMHMWAATEHRAGVQDHMLGPGQLWVPTRGQCLPGPFLPPSSLVNPYCSGSPLASARYPSSPIEGDRPQRSTKSDDAKTLASPMVGATGRSGSPMPGGSEGEGLPPTQSHVAEAFLRPVASSEFASGCSSLPTGASENLGARYPESFDYAEPTWLTPPFGKQHQLSG